MLEDLHIQNLALVGDSWLRFPPGLTVLTGETGAGKTVLLSAIKLLLGQRGDVSAISAGADELKVEGSFYFGEDEYIVSRELNVSGRNKCLLNGSLVPVKTLADELAGKVDLHGQHDLQTLLSPSNHLKVLDAFGREAVETPLQAYSEARARYIKAAETLASLQKQANLDNATFEANRLVLQEINRVNPLDNEDDALREELPALVHSEELAEAGLSAWSELTGEGGASDRIAHALGAMERVLNFDPSFEVAYKQLSGLAIDISELGASMRDYSQSVEHNSSRLDEVQNRLRELESLAKRFGPTLSEVIKKRDELQQLVDTVENSDERIGEATRLCEQEKAAYRAAAEKLSRTRRQIGHKLCELLGASLQDLALEHAALQVQFAELPFDQWTALSSEKIEFLYRPVLQAPFKPLSKIASGGELSRVMLGLKSILGKSDLVSILVFDEIDAGIGGAVATAVGRRLAELARTHQVLVITHLAQVAVFADCHYVVSKLEDDKGVTTEVALVEGEQRTQEVARMLSGEASQTALAHARELLNSVVKS